MRKRMTTDNPQGNLETMLNYAYAKDKRYAKITGIFVVIESI